MDGTMYFRFLFLFPQRCWMFLWSLTPCSIERENKRIWFQALNLIHYFTDWLAQCLINVYILQDFFLFIQKECCFVYARLYPFFLRFTFFCCFVQLCLFQTLYYKVYSLNISICEKVKAYSNELRFIFTLWLHRRQYVYFSTFHNFSSPAAHKLLTKIWACLWQWQLV